ncbi:LysR substrate-binding domain-containing protein [Microbulbifer sp. JMSA003]|uniref:LysR substrate-binding domain-containing protein n=1 Tax=Microbulbifer sp. JMSA003 TaxID=3243369 RepID=UPI00403A077F
MEIEALEKFLVIAATENLQRSADRLDTSPGGLSKTLKRLEGELGTRLFDRVGKQLKINEAGRRLQSRAVEMVAIARRIRSEVGELKVNQECRIAAPTMLQLAWGTFIHRKFITEEAGGRLSFTSAYEALALKMLSRGEVDLALITGAVLGQLSSTMDARPLGSVSMCIAAGPDHSLIVEQGVEVKASLSNILQYPFAAPRISPFCGEERGIGSDGWPEINYPRKVQVVVNDYGVLCQLVKNNRLLAFLPEPLITEIGGVIVRVEDGDIKSSEELFVVGRKTNASWLSKFAEWA